MTPETLRNDDACYLAMQARDARFDGCFFTGVTSTGIYCRPVCSVKTPKRENCRFFGHAAQAESAGFRPCLRCRPELAPHSLVWSFQDATSILAHQAARLLDEPAAWSTESASAQALATRLGISDRHLRRIFEAQFGVSPLQYLQTRRLLTAKQLLADTQLPIAQIALVSGFASVRRFNAVFAAHYGLNPSQLRRSKPATTSLGGTAIRLGYRPPYDVPAMLAFLQKRQINAIESVAGSVGTTCVARTFCLESAGAVHRGWLTAEFVPERHHVLLHVSDSLHGLLPLVIHRVRALLDLDADPKAINRVLHGRFPDGDGLRVPGALDGFELSVRAVLGQQITVAAARTLAQRLVDGFGETIDTPIPELSRLFPTPAVLAQLPGDALGQLGIVRQRQAAILALARAVADGQLQLHGGAQVHATVEALKTLPGIGDWTAQYIAMRALRWPDAFPAGDVALHKALGVQDEKYPGRAAEAASQAWKPWRSYAVLRAWAELPLPLVPPAPITIKNIAAIA
ncbi:AraC family transcriptional regulator of adaptative response / DNA-3-methyladenine glycosylase II [Rhodoferax ferrireducens]|uniref:DNA-3-methyladenine glycosylase II n=1 Tax=Rhodoferax ferrireducens TaxID=192843 RepID=A0ABU2C6R6_9BURK|nr:AlkA N-terminal domain-containing protein [Rhodoferax ferrireducens]MDR7376937.1 AraC family transcriptional regulator of adaptative response / DNA-3-methyladenine glycosylase II [Rhodoferax ferrireducens]